ncbi:hypothetical protein [Paenibacillus humicus]|uniref:hypothetical protein n=1 Tax=Paenibacillus humicus TaxID=412861 RepID=UPI00040762D1|nr:hypothetical protein [Paenibacillus humicus]
MRRQLRISSEGKETAKANGLVLMEREGSERPAALVAMLRPAFASPLRAAAAARQPPVTR